MVPPTIHHTIGKIAEQLHASVSQVRYVIDSRQIRPSGLAGNARVFDEAGVALIRAELGRINRRGRSGHVQLTR